MKKLLNWFEKQIKITPQEHAKELLINLLSNPDTDYQIETFESLKAQFYDVLENREIEHAKQCVLINGYFNPKKSKVYDPNFDKPLSEMEVDYELIKKV